MAKITYLIFTTMKLKKINKQAVQALATVCAFGYAIEFENTLMQNFMRDTLERLIIKLRRVDRKIFKATSLTFSSSEALCLYWSSIYFCNDKPQALEAVIAQELIIDKIS